MIPAVDKLRRPHPVSYRVIRVHLHALLQDLDLSDPGLRVLVLERGLRRLVLKALALFRLESNPRIHYGLADQAVPFRYLHSLKLFLRKEKQLD